MSTKIPSKETIAKEIEKSFIFSDLVVDCLYTGLVSDKNVLLFGEGGYGKSEITEAFFKTMGVEPFVQSCGEGMTVDMLFGGIDMKKFTDTGSVEYLVENSFMNHEYVVFEELLDAPMTVLLSLKDILTSKRFRNGTQQFNIKTKFIVCLTNRTRAEVSEDNSTKALMERFPLELEVKWPDYKEEYFVDMFQRVTKGTVDMSKIRTVANVVAMSRNKGMTVSPRTARYALDVFDKAGETGLAYIAGMSIDDINEIYKRQRQIAHESQYRDKINKVKMAFRQELNDFRNDAELMSNPIKIIATANFLRDKYMAEADKIKDVPNGVAKDYGDLKNGINSFHESMNQIASQALHELSDKYKSEIAAKSKAKKASLKKAKANTPANTEAVPEGKHAE